MRVTDYQGDVATQQFTATINPPLQVSGTMPAGTVGAAYSHDLIAQGGAPPYSWSIFANDPLPPGLTLGTTAPDFNNVLTGTPAQAGTFSFTVEVTDSSGYSAAGTATVTINS
jgi:Putative Ig domain